MLVSMYGALCKRIPPPYTAPARQGVGKKQLRRQAEGRRKNIFPPCIKRLAQGHTACGGVRLLLIQNPFDKQSAIETEAPAFLQRSGEMDRE